MYSLYCLSLTFHHYSLCIFPKYKHTDIHHASSQGYAPADVPVCLQLQLGQVKDPDAKKYVH